VKGFRIELVSVDERRLEVGVGTFEENVGQRHTSFRCAIGVLPYVRRDESTFHDADANAHKKR